MATFTSHSPAETAALGEVWGSEAQSGLVIGLCGDLGAGKTQLVKGLARGLGCTQLVRSPTFALVNTYTDGRLTLFHLDLYRLQTREQIIAAGLEEYLTPEGLTVIEWAERWLEAPLSAVRGPQSIVRTPLPAESLGVGLCAGPLRWVHIDVLSPTERRITYEDSGA
jgi:tRNA threonylcarbamoyl adenosine modification protein YjeE